MFHLANVLEFIIDSFCNRPFTPVLRLQSFVLTDTSVLADRHKCFARQTQVF